MKPPLPNRTLEYILDAYQRYYDTAFWLRDEGMMRERQAILNRPGVIAQDVLLEPVLPYLSIADTYETCKEAGLSDATAKSLAKIVFGGDFNLYDHQAEALKTSLAPSGAAKRNVVITSGTGSGKTESFLLPVLARLLDKAPAASPGWQLHEWWNESWNHKREWKGLRSNDPAAGASSVKALILYPTNALVEDQISRLRQSAIRANEGRAVPAFFFGRYTGATPGGTSMPEPERTQQQLKRVKREAEAVREIAEEALLLGKEPLGIRAQFPDPLCGEMMTRWDMVECPPDILITNVSMLNIMLMREAEKAIFEKSRNWLQADPENCFTIVVDELHGYRGTQGSEIALVLRNLFMRLGLAPDSPQLRCIGTSASLDGAEGFNFIEQFFCVDSSSFLITAGEPLAITGQLPLDATKAVDLAEAISAGEPRRQEAETLAGMLNVSQSLAAA